MPGQQRAESDLSFSDSLCLVVFSRVHLRWERGFSLEALIHNFRYCVGPALRSIEVLPYLQLTEESDSD
jgi:hypothetical protein